MLALTLQLRKPELPHQNLTLLAGANSSTYDFGPF